MSVSPFPWHRGWGGCIIAGPEQYSTVIAEVSEPEDMRRVLAAVNATKDVTTEGLEAIIEQNLELVLAGFLTIIFGNPQGRVLPIGMNRIRLMVELLLAARELREESQSICGLTSPGIQRVVAVLEKIEA